MNKNSKKRFVSCKHIYAIAILLILLTACATNKSQSHKNIEPLPQVASDTLYHQPIAILVEDLSIFEPDTTRVDGVQGMVRDLTIYSQDPVYYARYMTSNPNALLLTDEERESHLDDFHRKFYQAWTDTTSPTSRRIRDLLTYYRGQINTLFNAPGIGENKLRRDAAFAQEIKQIADLENGFNGIKKGIMVQYAHVRVMPTNKPFYLDFALAGEGYPFDYWQNSTIPIGTPITILHESQNWALIESHICSGWVPRNQVAYIDENTINFIINAQKIAITKEKAPIYDTAGAYKGFVDIGTVFSVIQETETSYIVALNSLQPPHITIPKNIAQKIPIPLTTSNIANLATQMMNQVYGWGGMYFNRDCSQMLLDLYIGFGILLPRNGRAQAYSFGKFHNTQNIIDATQRKEEIIEKAIPFLTLIRTPGHIMLYVGHIDGEPLVLHSIWGIRTNEHGVEGRHVIGRTVITTMEPGRELRNVNPNMTLIHRLEGMTFFER